MLVYIRGAGAIASAIAVRLYRANCKIVMSDLEHPRALRRTVSFSEAMRNGKAMVEDIEAVSAKDPEEAVRILRENKIAVLKDPEGDMRGTLPFDACVDATMRTGDTDTTMQDAPIVIGIGDRFRPGENCHAAVRIETRGNWGRTCYVPCDAASDPDTMHADSRGTFFAVPKAGLFYPVSEIGDAVKQGETLGVVDDQPVESPADGILCGILPEGTPVKKECVCGEILPEGRSFLLRKVAEEDLAIAGGVLEALLHFRETY